jgi:hypothetical protein
MLSCWDWEDCRSGRIFVAEAEDVTAGFVVVE